MSESSEKISKEKSMIAVVVLVMAVLLFVIGTKNTPDVNNRVKVSAKKIESSQTQIDDKWIKTLGSRTDDILIMEFIVKGLPNCSTFHQKTLFKGSALGIRCFENSGDDKGSYYYVLSGSPEFKGPFPSEQEMITNAEGALN